MQRGGVVRDPFAAPAHHMRRPAPPAQPPAAPDRGPLRWDGEPRPRLAVPLSHRVPGAAPCTAVPRLLSLEELLPGTGFAHAFHASAAFRRALRSAARNDLFEPPAGASAAGVAAVRALTSTLVLDWRRGLQDGVTPALDAVLDAAGVQLTGAGLFRGLTAPLAGGDGPPAGSLTDIVDTGRAAVRHSWHADCGLARNTLLLAFPLADGYDEPGVFSHVVALSHPLARTDGSARGSVLEWERVAGEVEIPWEAVLRPAFKNGAEVLVMDDSQHLHSAPDSIHREALWRFM